MSYDTVVIGAGLAGLTAALRLTEQGQRVLIVARGVGATHLAPATVKTQKRKKEIIKKQSKQNTTK